MKKYQKPKAERSAKTGGYVNIERSLLDDLMSNDLDRHQQAVVLICICHNLYFTAGYIQVRDRRIACQANQWVTTIRTLSGRTGLHRNVVHRQLRRLQDQGVIRLESCPYFTRIIWLGRSEDQPVRYVVSHKKRESPSVRSEREPAYFRPVVFPVRREEEQEGKA